MSSIEQIGEEWILTVVDNLTDHIDRMTPSEFNEKYRYLPESVSSMPGYLDYNVNPFMREIVDCFDQDSPVREVNLKKGVQVTYTTVLESVALYFMAHVKTLPIMYITSDKELAKARIENNFIPMLNMSDFGHIVRSSDEGNSRKTGKTALQIQFEGGGYLVPAGARNADKLRSYSICVMLKDETDSWLDTVGRDGDPERLTDDRCSGYWERRKILRGSTPLILGTSKIQSAYLRGDQRKYMVLCKQCNYAQQLRWQHIDEESGIVGGFQWEMDVGTLILESVKYCCQKCGAPHYEHDKEKLFSPDHGAHWLPTAKPAEPNIRSYHLPALYSPIGMRPWYKCVSDYLQGFDPVEKKVIDIGKYQVFYNNVLAEPFEIMGSKIRFTHVSPHRRFVYHMGEIPNKFAQKWSGSPILVLTCQVDVHKSNLAVTVMGWTKNMCCYVIDYWRFEVDKDEDDCSESSSPVWGRLRELIEEKEYIADDGKKYRIALTLIDSNYANDTVITFCSDYGGGVYPIIGRDRPAKNQKIMEFGKFTTQNGITGYKITVDHYKDRIAPVLRREWIEEKGLQKVYHFNAPMDITDKQLKELTAETRREKRDDKGRVSYSWYRPGNKPNELFDLLVYGNAAVEIIAHSIFIEHFEIDAVDWPQFWDLLESKKMYYTEK